MRSHVGIRSFLHLVDLDPGFADYEQIGDELGDGAFRRMELRVNQILPQDVIKIVEIFGNLASTGEIKRRLQMSNNQNRVPDTLGSLLDLILLDGDGGSTKVFDDLLIEPYYEFDRTGSSNRGFAIGLLNIHGLTFQFSVW